MAAAASSAVVFIETTTAVINWFKREEEKILLVNLTDERVTFASNWHTVECEAQSCISIDWAYAVFGGLAGGADVTVWVQGHKGQKKLIGAGECYKWDGRKGEHVKQMTQDIKDMIEK